MTNKGRIDATSAGSGDVGDITMQVAGSVLVTNGGAILSLALGSGKAGDITVTADRVVLSGVNSVPIVDANTGEENLAVSAIASQTQTGGGDAGDIRLQAGSLHVLDGAQIDARTFGAGNSGNIDVVADQVTIAGESAVTREFFSRQGGSPLAARSDISTSTESLLLGDRATGKAGSIRIQAGVLRLQDAGLINSETTGPGTGGNIDIVSEHVMLAGDARILAISAVSPNAGKAGTITITARDTFQSNNSIISSATTAADGGAIRIEAGQIQLSHGALVSVRSFGAGNAGLLTLTATDTIALMGQGSGLTATTAAQGQGGSIRMQARQVTLTEGASITAASTGLGDAGNITITVTQDSFLSTQGSVVTRATQADGGNIEITAPRFLRLRDSMITAEVGGGASTVGGNITIDPQFILLQNSQIVANAFQGRGGNIQLQAQRVLLADPSSSIDASSALGIDGQVAIQAPVTSISGAVLPLSQTFARGTELLRDRCVERARAGGASRFVLVGRDRVPWQPGHWLASPLERLRSMPSAYSAPMPHARLVEETDVWSIEDARPPQLVEPYVQGQALEVWDVACGQWLGAQHTTHPSRH